MYVSTTLFVTFFRHFQTTLSWDSSSLGSPFTYTFVKRRREWEDCETIHVSDELLTDTGVLVPVVIATVNL